MSWYLFQVDNHVLIEVYLLKLMFDLLTLTCKSAFEINSEWKGSKGSIEEKDG